MVDARTAIANAEAAAEYASSVRAYHRKRTRRHSTQRQTDIEVALTRLREAMKPCRALIARHAYRPVPEVLELKAASQKIQSERRKLWKMR